MVIPAKEKITNNSVRVTEFFHTHQLTIIIGWWIFLLINMYLEIPLVIPGPLSILAFPVLASLPFLWYSCGINLRRSDTRLAVSIFLCTVVSILSGTRLSGLAAYPTKVMQLVFAVVAGITVYRVTECIPLRYKQIILFSVTLILITGITLEALDWLFIKEISNYVRTLLFEGSVYGLYEGEGRDIDIVGFARPKFFTSEPSLAATGYFIFSSCYLLVTTNYIHLWLILALDIICVKFTGSPASLLTFFVWIWIYNVKATINWPTVLPIAVVAVVVLVFALTPEALFGKLVTRLLEETVTPNMSLYSRLYVPYFEALPTSLRYNPLFGVGYAGKEILAGLMQQEIIDNDVQFILGTNAFARFIAFYGLLGTGILLYVFHRFFKTNRVYAYTTIILIWFLYSQMLGPMETARYWMYLFLIINLTKHMWDIGKIKTTSIRFSL